MKTTVGQAKRDVYKAKARLKRAELRAGASDRLLAAGDAVTTVVTEKVAPAVHDAFADHVVPAVHDAFAGHVVPTVRDTFTDKVAPAVTDRMVPAVRDTVTERVLPAAQKAARRGAKRSAALSREAAARLAESDAAQHARRRAEEALTNAAAKASGTTKPGKRRGRLFLLLGVLGGGAVIARRSAQRAYHGGLPTAGPAGDLNVPGTATTVDLTTDQRSAPTTDQQA